MAKTTLMCESCGEELFGAEDICPICGHVVERPQEGLLARIPLTPRQLAVVGAGVLVILGSLFPWSTVERAGETVSTSGTESLPGIVTLIAGIVMIALVPLSLRARWLAGWVAALPFGIGLYKGLTTDIQGLAAETPVSTVELGLFMVIIGGTIGFIFRFRLD